MIAVALTAHSQLACCLFLPFSCLCQILEKICKRLKFKTPVTCVVIVSLVSSAKRFSMYCTGNNMTNRYRVVPCIS